MAKIVIKDLTENAELDSQAMAAIVGGSRAQRAKSPTTRRLFTRPQKSILNEVIGHEKFGGLPSNQ